MGEKGSIPFKAGMFGYNYILEKDYRRQDC